MKLLISDRVEIAEAEVFQLAADFSHPQAVCDGPINFQCLFRNFLLAIRRQVFQSPHVVQAVGQFDEDDAYVIDHCQHHLAQIFCLLLFASGEINFADLGYALDQMGDLLAEFLADVDDGD